MRLLATCLVLGGFALEGFFVRIAQLGDLRQHAEVFLRYFGAAFALYLGLVWMVRRADRDDRWPNRWVILGVVIGSFLFRLTLFHLPPTLSDDIYRYLWDARVQQAGINPYRYAPSDEALRSLRDEAWSSVNHKDIATIYPPLTQLAFRLDVWLSPTLLMQKAVFLACDLAIVVLLPTVFLPRWGINPLMGLLYAWHPLVVVEVAGSGHNDPLGVVFLLLGLACWHQRKRLVGTIGFALTFLAKFTSALLWPFYWLRARSLFFVFLAVSAVGGLPCWLSPHAAPGLGHYSSYWEFNGSVYPLLEAGFGHPLSVRILCVLATIAIGVALARRSDDLLGYTITMIQTAILLTPVLEPWYLLWLIPLLCLRPSWMWLVFSGLVMLSYMVLVPYVHEGLWQIPSWVKWVEYTPLYAWLIFSGLRRTIGRSNDGLFRILDS